MRSKSSYAPFSVYIRDNLLVVKRSGEDGTRTLCTVDLRRQPTFFLSDAGVMCCDTLGNVFTVESSANGGNDQLLAALSGAQLQQAEKWRSRWGTRCPLSAATMCCIVRIPGCSSAPCAAEATTVFNFEARFTA